MKKNIIANLVGRFWSILSSFVFIPIYIKFLGFESYSVISFTIMIAGIMVVLDGGLTATLSREFSRIDTSDVKKKNIYNTLETCYYFVVLICIISIFFTSNYIANNWIIVKGFSPEKISIFLKIVSFEVGFQFLFRFYTGGLIGLERQIEANVYQVGWGILRNGLVIIPIYFYPALDVFFIWQAVSSILFTVVIKFALQKRISGNKSFIILKLNNEVLKNTGKFAGGMLLIAIVSALNTQLDKITISKLLSIENLGYYTLAVSLSQGLIILVNPISTALLPRFTAIYSNGNREEASLLFEKYSMLISLLIIVVMIIMAFFSKSLLWIWTGDHMIAEKAYRVLPVILFSYGMIALQVLPYNIVIANGNTKINNILGMISLLVTIPGYYIFTNRFGVLGAAYTFCFVQTITTVVYLYLVNKKYLNLTFGKDILIKRIIAPLIIITVIVFDVSNVPFLFENDRVLHLLWIGFCFLVTMLITFLIFVSFKEIENHFPTNFFKTKDE